MPNMLDFFRGKQDTPRPSNSISVRSTGPLVTRNIRSAAPRATQEQLSRAAAVYGAAAAVFAVLTVYMLFTGMWFTGLIMILPTFCLGGFCWYYMKP